MRLFDAAKTVDIVSIYQKLTGKKPKKTKGGAIACCPLHDDKHPSMTLFQDNNRFYCHGCDTKGSGIDLVMGVLKLDDRAAADWICHEFGVEYDAPSPTPAEAPGAPFPSEAYFAVCAKLAVVFREWLDHSPDPMFFHKRGIGALVDEFSLGYCPKRKLFKEEARDLVARLGLGTPDGGCVFAGRYVVPLRDYHGRVVGFIGRAPDEDVANGAPKYLVPQSSPCFRKGSFFFNGGVLLDKSLTNVIVVEGVMDALAYIAAGVRNVVSPLGCSLRDAHLAILGKAQPREVIVAFDGDEAGKAATLKAIGYARNLKVSILDGGFGGCKDANELLLTKGPEALAAATKGIPAVEYLIREAEAKGLDGADAQDALWDAVARAIGSREPEYRARFPINTAYNPSAFCRMWKAYDDAVARHPLR